MSGPKFKVGDFVQSNHPMGPKVPWRVLSVRPSCFDMDGWAYEIEGATGLMTQQELELAPAAAPKPRAIRGRVGWLDPSTDVRLPYAFVTLDEGVDLCSLGSTGTRLELECTGQPGGCVRSGYVSVGPVINEGGRWRLHIYEQSFAAAVPAAAAGDYLYIAGTYGTEPAPAPTPAVLSDRESVAEKVLVSAGKGALWSVPFVAPKPDPYPPKCIRCDGRTVDGKCTGRCALSYEPRRLHQRPEPPPDPPHVPSLSPGAVRGPMGRR